MILNSFPTLGGGDQRNHRDEVDPQEEHRSEEGDSFLVPDKTFCIVVVSIPYQLKAKFGFDSVSKMGLNMVGAAVVVPDASDGTEPENPYDGNFLDKHKKQESLER